MDDGGWEEVPCKKQLRRERQQQQRRQWQQEQQQKQQHAAGWDGATGQPRRRGKGKGRGGMAAPSMVPAPLTVVVLVGTPGCGKSTFCAALNGELVQSSAFPEGAMPQPVRVSQDDLGGRKACEALCESALRAGHNVVIDRCNFDQQQRSTWLRIGKSFGATIVAAFLNTPIDTCKQRVLSRTNHPTLGPTAESMAVVDRFRSLLKPPRKSEGFSLIVEASEDMASVQAAARILADHLLAAMVAGQPAPTTTPKSSATSELGASVPRSFSMRAMQALLAEPNLSAPQRAAAAAALAQHQDDQAAAAAAQPLESVSSSELEQARLEGEVRALARLAAATRDPAECSGKMSVVAPAAADAALLQQTRDEIDRLRTELGLREASSGSSGDVSSGSGMGDYSGLNVDAPAWQPGRSS